MSDKHLQGHIRFQLINEIAQSGLSIEEKSSLVNEFDLLPLNCTEIGMLLNVSGKSVEKFLKRTFLKSKKIIGNLEDIRF